MSSQLWKAQGGAKQSCGTFAHRQPTFGAQMPPNSACRIVDRRPRHSFLVLSACATRSKCRSTAGINASIMIKIRLQVWDARFQGMLCRPSSREIPSPLYLSVGSRGILALPPCSGFVGCAGEISLVFAGLLLPSSFYASWQGVSLWLLASRSCLQPRTVS